MAGKQESGLKEKKGRKSPCGFCLKDNILEHHWFSNSTVMNTQGVSDMGILVINLWENWIESRLYTLNILMNICLMLYWFQWYKPWSQLWQW